MRQTALQKATKNLEIAGLKHCLVLYGAAGIVLRRHWGKKERAITGLYALSRTIWKDCAKDHDHSMIQMCEDETGIEIQNGDGKSWRDLAYLNGELDPGRMTEAQWLYMRQQQLKWIRPQIMACLMVALHRKYGFGFERCGRIYQQIEDVSTEFGHSPTKIRQACKELTGIDVMDVVTGKGEKDE